MYEFDTQHVKLGLTEDSLCALSAALLLHRSHLAVKTIHLNYFYCKFLYSLLTSSKLSWQAFLKKKSFPLFDKETLSKVRGLSICLSNPVLNSMLPPCSPDVVYNVDRDWTNTLFVGSFHTPDSLSCHEHHRRRAQTNSILHQLQFQELNDQLLNLCWINTLPF